MGDDAVKDAVKRGWPPIRAGLITLAIFLGLVDGLPLPDSRAKKRMSPGTVEVIDDIEKARAKILRPFRFFPKLVRAHQKWNLFAGASKSRYRMWIEARTGPDAPWQPLYKVFDDEHDFMADQMLYRRMRGAWAPRGSRGPRGAYSSFATFVAREIFARWPEYTEVRVAMEKVTVGPRGGATYTGELTYEQRRTRDDVARKEAAYERERERDDEVAE
jgi:hypothetical protein